MKTADDSFWKLVSPLRYPSFYAFRRLITSTPLEGVFFQDLLKVLLPGPS